MSSRFESLTGVVDRPFPEYDVPPAEPMSLVGQWITSAIEAQVREPLSLALATADQRGRASNRTVSVIDVSAKGLLFTSHSTSQKGREIAETGWGSGLLYWRETGQQLIVSGPVAVLAGAEADRLWQARPAPLHSMTTASRQSDPVADLEGLRGRAEALAQSGTPLPRPERFVGYRLEPAVVEFWSAADDRAHRRLRYDLTPDGWRVVRLQP
ncbi:pyridoxal 5'-phosphate synthase [Streptomyces montanus]|uniref:Pyridoxal 5'-phosphate synthase n=1 Tax=Streptomyces montanus TaxID=2580423 RepID=A0A5R9FTG5_9ACTN|nr:phenazine biosynthesis FMN-dependent oxidase PhzG [Streptomyces montanus]TLS43784.1 pyridoxal 5'-phosphate synthase [Streptomyces montanus]